jgi:hypothetical protein
MAAATSERARRRPVAPLVADLGRSWRLPRQAQKKSGRTIEQYIELLRLFDRFLAESGVAQQITSIGREHVEMFIADILTRAASRDASGALGPLIG